MYLVTGGAGFIGSHIVNVLVKQGKKVRVLDNFSAGKAENLAGVRNKIHLIKGDIRDKRTVKNAAKGIKYILHQAALCSVPKSIKNPEEFNAVNINGTFNLLLAARDARVKCFIFASSSSVYGETQKLPKKESFVLQPLSPYAVTKLAGETYCRVFWESYGLPTITIRYFNVFGPRQNLDSQYAAVIPKFITYLLKNQSPPIYGDGKQSRDFTYVDNVVVANIRALKAKPPAFGKVFNVACGKGYTVKELVRLLNKLMDKNIKPIFLPPRKGDIKHSWAGVSLARKYLNYKPMVNLKQGLKYTIEYYKRLYDKF